MAPMTPAMANVDRRKQLLQKLQAQAANHSISLMRGGVGNAGTIGMARSGARAPVVHGASIANFLRAHLGVQGGFAPGAPASNYAPADQAPAPPPPPAGQNPTPPAAGDLGAPASAPAAPAASPGGPVGTGTYTPTASDLALQGATGGMWANEAAGNPTAGSLIPLGNGMFLDPVTGAITGAPAPTTGSGPAGALGHGRVL